MSPPIVDQRTARILLERQGMLQARAKEVLSVDIYDAVLDHGVRSPDDFASWLASQRRR